MNLHVACGAKNYSSWPTTILTLFIRRASRALAVLLKQNLWWRSCFGGAICRTNHRQRRLKNRISHWGSVRRGGWESEQECTPLGRTQIQEAVSKCKEKKHFRQQLNFNQSFERSWMMKLRSMFVGQQRNIYKYIIKLSIVCSQIIGKPTYKLWYSCVELNLSIFWHQHLRSVKIQRIARGILGIEFYTTHVQA